jgi:hypothetical protein
MIPTKMKPEVEQLFRGKQFVNTSDNRALLANCLASRAWKHTPENMAQALYDLTIQGHIVLEFTPTEAAKRKAAADANLAHRLATDPILKAKRAEEKRIADEAADAAYWQERARRQPGDANSLMTLQRYHRERVAAGKEAPSYQSGVSNPAFAQAAFAARPEPVAAQQPAGAPSPTDAIHTVLNLKTGSR